MDNKLFLEENAKIVVIGVGGGGGNAVNHMIAEGGMEGVEFVAINTDNQALKLSLVPEENRIRIGDKISNGLGAGANPEVGRKAAEENKEEIRQKIEHADMVFVTAGMGGGTGTGAAPVVAQIAQELGKLTVAVVTMPFKLEGMVRNKQANEGRANLIPNVDTIITIPNERLKAFLAQQGKKVGLKDAFKEIDNVLLRGVKGVCELIIIPALINLDFADVKAIMQIKGSALMGIGEGEGEEAAKDATLAAMHNPLLPNGLEGALGVILNVTGGPNLAFEDIDTAMTIVNKYAAPNVNTIFGAMIDENMPDDRIKVTILATGFSYELEDELPVNALPQKPDGINVLQQTKPQQPVQQTTYQQPTYQQPTYQQPTLEQDVELTSAQRIENLSNELRIPSFLKNNSDK